MYEVILHDKGKIITIFDKKYVAEPLGYSLEELGKTLTNLPKLNAKSRRTILERP
jgi:hypothetical protein